MWSNCPTTFAITFDGALGNELATAEALVDCREFPTEFTAMTAALYVTPFVKPLI